MKYSEVQKLAKDTIEYIKNEIHAGMKLTEVRRLCENICIDGGMTKQMIYHNDCGWKLEQE